MIPCRGLFTTQSMLRIRVTRVLKHEFVSVVSCSQTSCVGDRLASIRKDEETAAECIRRRLSSRSHFKTVVLSLFLSVALEVFRASWTG